MIMDFVVFGHGYDGDRKEGDYNGEGTVDFFRPIGVGALSVESGGFVGQPLTKVTFTVHEHKSSINGKIYMLAIEDGFVPEDVDFKILHSMVDPRP
ncbi:hypothetical protein CLM71_10045 [Serratia sp. MYb239]|uniref:hypothetical protein n=1 Tax=Serratia sp. MYb239 TaxID=2033438 RepID=UPI000CF657A2|nr:hypothetical protein [Serratia sp. MYb239]AVJ17457.1 hypothetical protein CLM71_10045 [Serratia sp. MYb239]